MRCSPRVLQPQAAFLEHLQNGAEFVTFPISETGAPKMQFKVKVEWSREDGSIAGAEFGSVDMGVRDQRKIMDCTPLSSVDPTPY